MEYSARAALIERYLTAYNAFDVAGMLALLTAAVRFENYSGGQLTAATSGIEEFTRLADQSKGLFSEREQRVTGIESDGDALVAAIAYRGVLAADIPDGPRAGTVLELTGTSEFRFAEGKIAMIVDRS